MQTKKKSQVLEENKASQKLAILKEREKERIAYKGLCLTCKNTLFCTYQRDRTQPVLFCEEFDRDIVIINKAPSKIHLDSAQIEKSLGKYKKL